MANPTAKEKIYDSMINPLVSKIIQITQDHGIAIGLHFDISDEEAPDLVVSTVMPDEKNQIPRSWTREPIAPAADAINFAEERENPGYADKDGSVQITLRD